MSLYEREAMATSLGVDALGPAPSDAPGFELGFKVVDVDAAYAELVAAGADAVTSPHDRPWGQRTAYVADPTGT